MAIRRAHRRIEQRASKKQSQTKPETWEYAKYVAVFTTEEASPTERILDWYRVRWQVELVFKRLKSLAQLGHLPKYDARSPRAWLYGKLFVALLTQKLIRVGRDISPWEYELAEGSAPKRVARVQLRAPPSAKCCGAGIADGGGAVQWDRLAYALAERPRERRIQRRKLG